MTGATDYLPSADERTNRNCINRTSIFIYFRFFSIEYRKKTIKHTLVIYVNIYFRDFENTV